MTKAPTISHPYKTFEARELPLNDPDLQDLIDRCREIKKPQPAAKGALPSSSSSSFSSHSDVASHAPSNQSHDSNSKRGLHSCGTSSSSSSDLTGSSHVNTEKKGGGMETKLTDLLDKLQKVEEMLVDVRINEEGRRERAAETDESESMK